MDELKPPLTAPIGLETRNWLWKRVDLAKESLALITNCEDPMGLMTCVGTIGRTERNRNEIQ